MATYPGNLCPDPLEAGPAPERNAFGGGLREHAGFFAFSLADSCVVCPGIVFVVGATDGCYPAFLVPEVMGGVNQSGGRRCQAPPATHVLSVWSSSRYLRVRPPLFLFLSVPFFLLYLDPLGEYSGSIHSEAHGRFSSLVAMTVPFPLY